MGGRVMANNDMREVARTIASNITVEESEKIMQILIWVGENMKNLPEEDMIYCMGMTAKFAYALEPLYDKYRNGDASYITS